MARADGGGRGGLSRREALAGGGIGLGAALLAACSPQTGGGQGGASPGQGAADLSKRPPVKLEFWGSPPTTGSNNRSDQIDFWNQKYPNLNVTFGTTNTTGQGVEAVAAILASVAAGSPPDVVDFDRFQTTSFSVKGVWQALDDFIKRDKFDTSHFAPLVVPEAKGLDGKWYALIRSTDDRLIYWNKEAFQEVGLDPEKPPATWDELRQFAIRLTKRGGPTGIERAGFHTEEGQSHYHLFAWQNGGAFQTADGKKGTLPLGPNQEALQWMADLMKDLGGWGTLKAFRDSWGKDAQQGFLVGQVAMVYQTNNYASSTVAKFRADMPFGIAPPPLKKAGDKPLTWSGGFGYNLIHDSKKQDPAWEFMKWLVSEEGWTVANDGDLGRAKALGQAFVPGMSGQPDLDKKMYEKYKSGIPAVDKMPDVAVPLMQYSRVREPSIAAQNLWDAVKTSQTEAISQAKSAKQALEDNQAILQKALDEAWAAAPSK
jgi:ABC-type glycerol-3-phosphate transport system substrate-binding protein